MQAIKPAGIFGQPNENVGTNGGNIPGQSLPGTSVYKKDICNVEMFTQMFHHSISYKPAAVQCTLYSVHDLIILITYNDGKSATIAGDSLC